MATRTTTWAPYGAFAACAAIWGSTFLAIRIGNETVPPIWGAALRLVIAAVVLVALARITRQPLPRGAALSAALGYGVFQFGVNLPLLYWGETEVSSGLSAVIYATIPLTMAILARVLGIESLTRAKLVGALVALVGVAIIFSGESMSGTRLLPVGAVFAATWTACLGTLLLKRGPAQSAIGANAVGSAVGAPVCLAISALAGEPWSLPASVRVWFPVLYLAIVGSVGAFVVFAWLIQRWPATRASYISVVIPLVAVTLGALVRAERLHAATLAGSIVVIGGVALGLRASRLPSARRP
jgi:drug/metabolite transporter (DMT)-like permease